MSKTMIKETKLPPFEYKGSNAVNIRSNPYLWGRNLLANRKFMCPVIFLEPYCMNSADVYERVQVGDYAGLKKVNGIERKSIYREYVDGVVAGLVEYYGK